MNFRYSTTFTFSGPFLERPGNLSGPKSNSRNCDPLAVKKLRFMFLYQNVSDIKKVKVTAKFRSLKHLLVKDAKGFISPEKFRDVREAGLLSLS